MQGRRWCFTINNPNHDGQPITTEFLGENCKFIVCQLERGELGTLHFQGYAEFSKSLRLAAVKKLQPRANWRIAKGTKEHNIAYCTKADSRIEGGGPYIDGISEDKNLLTLAKELGSDEFLLHCISKHIPHGYYNELVRRFANDTRTIRDFEIPPGGIILEGLNTLRVSERPSTIVIQGKTGIGKTLWAKLNAPKPALWVRHIDDLRFFTREHKSIIFDDMDFKGEDENKKGKWPRTSQIHLVDQENDSSIHIRYGTALIPANTWKIFTCNEFPFTDDPAIKRRVNTHVFY